MIKQFEHKPVLVTGGASGMGRTTTLAFDSEDAPVLVADVARPAGKETAL